MFTGNQLRLPVDKKEDPAKKCGMKGNRKDQKKYFEKTPKICYNSTSIFNATIIHIENEEMDYGIIGTVAEDCL